jgi:hypothetical protein
VLAGLPKSTIAPLQRVQNAAARFVLDLRFRDHVMPALKQLHWLPVTFRIQFKLCLLMNLVHIGRSPVYVADMVTAVSSASTRPGLRSAAGSDYVKPRTRTRIGERAFHCAGPAAWNAVPEYIRSVRDTIAFKRCLKTHLFRLAYEQ